MGFFENPFSIKPALFDNVLNGYESLIDKINQTIAESKFILVYGKYGTGKTTILKGIINRFGGKKKVIYYNCDKSDRSIDFDSLLINSGSFFTKLFGIKKKNRIMLLDEAQDMNQKDFREIKSLYDKCFFFSVVFVSTKEDFGMTKDLQIMIEKNKFKLKEITEKDAVNLVRKRIGNIEYISDENISRIFNKDKNPRSFLKNCEDIFRFAYESESKEVTLKHIKEILG